MQHLKLNNLITSQYMTAESLDESKDAKGGGSPRNHSRNLSTVHEKLTEENTPAGVRKPLGNSPSGQVSS
jgi:hypothetical protein